jgi:hypothetical protein
MRVLAFGGLWPETLVQITANLGYSVILLEFPLLNNYAWKYRRTQRSQPLSLFTELRRLNVFKVSVAYGIIAWLFAQVLQLAFEIFSHLGWAISFPQISNAHGRL